MERGSLQGIAAGLEQIVENTRSELMEAIDQFQELCFIVTPERDVSREIITDIRQTYKQIQDQLSKIRGAKQLLEAKYRQYYRRDSRREREIMDIAFLARSLDSKFEYTLQEIEAKKRRKDRGDLFGADRQRMLFPWFHSRGNQVLLLRNLRNLRELDYKKQSDPKFEARRKVLRDGMRSVSLFVLSGKVDLINRLESRIRFREHDITERYKEDELRGALTHLREISPPEVEKVIRRFMDDDAFLKLKCLLLRIRSQKDLEKEIIASTDNVLRVMGMGEIRTLSI